MLELKKLILKYKTKIVEFLNALKKRSKHYSSPFDHWELDKPQEALKVLEQALSSNPERPGLLAEILANLAEVYEKLERYDDAIGAAKKVLELIDYDDDFAN